MIKDLLKKVYNRFWRRQDKKLNKLQKTVDRLEKELDEQKRITQNLQRNLENGFLKHEKWTRQAAEERWLAKEKKIWVIKCPIANNEDKYLNGEYNFAVSLKMELEKLGCYVVIDMGEDWNRDMTEADVVLVLRVRRSYRPDRRNKNCKYIMWHFCHPSLVSQDEYELFDLVLVNSVSYAEKAEKEVSVPVKPLLCCADTNLFFPREEEVKYDKVFVGNTRKVTRQFITWCDKHDIPLHIWGKMHGPDGWKNNIREGSAIVLEDGVKNCVLPQIYRASRIIFNDHFDDMRELGFLNNRVIEALCCGRPLISDYCADFEKLFGDSVVFYRDEEDFLEKLKMLEENYDEQREKVLDFWPVLQKEFSFEARAKTLVEEVEGL